MRLSAFTLFVVLLLPPLASAQSQPAERASEACYEVSSRDGARDFCAHLLTIRSQRGRTRLDADGRRFTLSGPVRLSTHHSGGTPEAPDESVSPMWTGIGTTVFEDGSVTTTMWTFTDNEDGSTTRTTKTTTTQPDGSSHTEVTVKTTPPPK